MRCLALAQAWQDADGQATFAMALNAPAIEARLRAEGIGVAQLAAQAGSSNDAALTISLARELNAGWVVVDGYKFGGDYQREITDAGLSLLFIDDNGHANHYHANLVLNQNIGAHASLYAQRETHTRLLLGPRYLLLRREFSKWRGWKPETPDASRKVLVTLGGGDSDSVTLRVIEALQQLQIDGLEATVTVGANNPRRDELEVAARRSPLVIRLESNVTNMSELMAWADVAVTGAGSTCWELIFMGLPSTMLVLAENQHAVAENLGAADWLINLGWHQRVSSSQLMQAIHRLIFSPGQRAEMVRKGQDIIDGSGTRRILKEMSSEALILRRAAAADCDLVWQWVNDSGVRASAFSSEIVPLEEHKQWFEGKLNDPGCLQFIGLNSNRTPIGQVRFDVRNGEAEVDVSVAPNQRRHGYGVELIRKGVEALWKETSVRAVHAFVKTENQASVQAFLSAGFVKQGVEMVKGQRAIRLTWRGNE